MAELATVTTKLAAGDSVAVPHLGGADELGALAGAVEQFRSAVEMRADTDAEVAKEQQAVKSALADGLTALTVGDLTNVITADFPAGYGVLMTDFNSALSSLRGLISGVTDSAEGIRTGSHEIALASDDLARRTEGNAASLEETSAALVQIDTRLTATALSSGETVTRAD